MNPGIFEERDSWQTPLGLSVAFHTILFGSMLLYAAIWGSMRGETWGGGGAGGAIAVNLVSTAAIPLPATQSQNQNVLANESKGLSQSLPKQKEIEQPEAIPIPDRSSKKVKKAPLAASNTRPQPAPEPTNVVPFGQGGPASSIPFRMAGGSGGISMSGAGAGDFGSKYSWYVDKVRRVISENWLKYEVGPNVNNAARVYLTFEITRDGRPINVQVEQSSHVPSLDYSALNALKRIDSFGPLPSDYRGSSVMVEFFFDLNR